MARKKKRIYKITCSVNGKIYIGQTIKEISKRLAHHLSNSHNSSLLNDVREFGKNKFKINLLEYCDLDIADERERFYIQKYQSFVHEKGYNRTFGGKGGGTIELMEPERKAAHLLKLSERMKRMWDDPEYVEFQKRHSLGIKRTEETKQRLRDAMLIAQNRPEVKQKKSDSMKKSRYCSNRGKAVYFNSPDGIIEFTNRKEAIEKTGVQRGLIEYHLAGSLKEMPKIFSHNRKDFE